MGSAEVHTNGCISAFEFCFLSSYLVFKYCFWSSVSVFLRVELPYCFPIPDSDLAFCFKVSTSARNPVLKSGFRLVVALIPVLGDEPIDD